MTDEDRAALYKKCSKDLAKELYDNLHADYLIKMETYPLGVPFNRVLIEILKAEGYKFRIEYLKKHDLLKEEVGK